MFKRVIFFLYEYISFQRCHVSRSLLFYNVPYGIHILELKGLLYMRKSEKMISVILMMLLPNRSNEALKD